MGRTMLRPEEIEKLLDMIGTPPQNQEEFNEQSKMCDILESMIPSWY